MQTHNLLLVTFLSSVSMPLADEAMKLVMEQKLVETHLSQHIRTGKRNSLYKKLRVEKDAEGPIFELAAMYRYNFSRIIYERCSPDVAAQFI